MIWIKNNKAQQILEYLGLFGVIIAVVFALSVPPDSPIRRAVDRSIDRSIETITPVNVPLSYHWEETNCSCSVDCGFGVMTCTLRCLDNTNTIVNNTFCSGLPTNHGQDCYGSDCCGNGTLEQGDPEYEECEFDPVTGVENFFGQTCASFGFDGGSLECFPQGSLDECKIDKEGCFGCGDGDVNGPPEGSEECEEGILGGETCETKGYAGGILDCYDPNTSDECKYDYRGCFLCGDGTKNGVEECDGLDMGIPPKECTDLAIDETDPSGGNFHSGTLACYPPDPVDPLRDALKCTFDTTACDFCGDGQVNGPPAPDSDFEECDGGTKPCAGEMAPSCGIYVCNEGTITCDENCRWDKSDCKYTPAYYPYGCADCAKDGRAVITGVRCGPCPTEGGGWTCSNVSWCEIKEGEEGAWATWSFYDYSDCAFATPIAPETIPENKRACWPVEPFGTAVDPQPWDTVYSENWNRPDCQIVDWHGLAAIDCPDCFIPRNTFIYGNASTNLLWSPINSCGWDSSGTFLTIPATIMPIGAVCHITFYFSCPGGDERVESDTFWRIRDKVYACGDGWLDPEEWCDGNSFLGYPSNTTPPCTDFTVSNEPSAPAACEDSERFTSGNVACNPAGDSLTECRFDYSSCTCCGDGNCDAPNETAANCAQDCQV